MGEQKAKEFDSKEVLQLVTFRLGKEEYSVDILSVQEIIRHMELTAVPKAPEFVDGVINLRGKVIPVLDLRKRFGLEASGRDGGAAAFDSYGYRLRLHQGRRQDGRTPYNSA
jgi:purine-binding chemotaxis protein CheW